MKPLISVIVPVYNKEDFISSTVESLLAQTYHDIEIILVNDGSKDKSLEICNKLSAKDRRIKVVDKDNGGVSSARNAGLRAASGEYIGFVDGDDSVLPQMYESLIENTEKYKVDVSVCGFLCGGDKISGGKGLYEPKDFIKKNMKRLNVWNKLFKRELLKKLYFNESLSYAEDMLFCFEALLRAKKVFADERSFYLYNVNQRSATRQVFSSKQMASFKVFKILLQNEVVKQDASLSKALKMYKTYNMVGFLRAFTEAGYNRKYVINFFIRNIRENIVPYMFSGYPLFNRLFALSVSINFNLAEKIYKFIFNIG